MSTEREELELAALATGIELSWGIYEGGYQHASTDRCFYRRSNGQRYEWNPLHDNADSFDLQVRLFLHVLLFKQTEAECPAFVEVWEETSLDPAAVEYVTVDANAATRLAIFRCAVEIGRKMKETGD